MGVVEKVVRRLSFNKNAGLPESGAYERMVEDVSNSKKVRWEDEVQMAVDEWMDIQQDRRKKRWSLKRMGRRLSREQFEVL